MRKPKKKNDAALQKIIDADFKAVPEFRDMPKEERCRIAHEKVEGLRISALFVGEILSVDKAELIQTASRDLDGFEALLKDFDEQSKNAECMKRMFESGRTRLLVALSFAQAQKAA